MVHRSWLFLLLFTKYAWMRLRGLHVLFELPEPDAAPDADSDDGASNFISAFGDPSTDAGGMLALRCRS